MAINYNDLFKGMEWAFVGPTVDDDVQRLIWRYGADAVKNSIALKTKAKMGRPPDNDWPLLVEVLQTDAREWLSGGDPCSSRSNYSIARDFAKKHPGHSPSGTHQRIEDKLKKSRFRNMLLHALVLSRNEYPYAAHLNTLKELNDQYPHKAWLSSLDLANNVLTKYQAKFGNPPSPAMTFTEIEAALLNSPEPLATQPVIGGLAALGAFSVKSEEGND